MSTPNIGLNLPAFNTDPWFDPIQANWGLLDLLLSGNSSIKGIQFSTQAPTSNPPTGVILLYLNGDGTLHTRTSNGTDVSLGGGSATVAWGGITGTLSSQTDLQNALNAKQNTLTLPLPVASGGTGITNPGLVAGSNVAISGSWPNQTVSATTSGGSVSKLTGSATFDPGSVGDTTLTTLGTTVTVTGAAVGDVCEVSSGTSIPAGCELIGRVTATNTVTIKVINLSGLPYAPGSTVFNAVVLH